MKLIFCIFLFQWLFYWQETGVSCESVSSSLSSSQQEPSDVKQPDSYDNTNNTPNQHHVYADNHNEVSNDVPDLRYGDDEADNEQSNSDEDSFLSQEFHMKKPMKHHRLNKVMKRARLVKKFKPIIYDGYTLDINIDLFKSTRYCHYNEVCKNRYKSHFECLCPTNSLCVGQGSLFEGRCNTNLMPYVWIQSVDDTIKIKPKL